MPFARAAHAAACVDHSQMVPFPERKLLVLVAEGPERSNAICDAPRSSTEEQLEVVVYRHGTQ